MEFLKAVTAKEALGIIESFPLEARTEEVSIDNACGRVVAEDVVSHEAIPSFSRSLVDGYAVIAKDTQGARETSPSFLKFSGEVRIGEEAAVNVSEGSCVLVSTGSMVPEGADGIVMQEYVRAMEGEVEVTRPIHKGENIIYTGEDVEPGAVVVPRGRRLGPFDIGVLAAIGAVSVVVRPRPRVALFSSGDEIVPVDEKPASGRIRDINRYTVTELFKRAGADVTFCGIARDSVEDISQKLSAAREYDLIAISGGSSKGERDCITDSIEKLDGKILFHGINVKPGKPTIFGRLFGKPVFGLPGHPVSCAMVTARFVLPLVRRMVHESAGPPVVCAGTLSTNVPSAYGVEEYVRVKLERSGDGFIVRPIFAKSSVISSLSGAHGYIVVTEEAEGFEQGERVEVNLFE